MSNGLSILFSDVKDFFGNEVNRVFILQIFICIIGVSLGFIIISAQNKILESNAQVLKAVEKVEKKVDFRYFNTVKSLEGIHNVKIDTHYGELKK